MKMVTRELIYLGKIVITSISILVIGFICVVLYEAFKPVPPSQKGAIYETRYFEGNTFEVKVTAYKEVRDSWTLLGAYFVFESLSKTENTQSQIFEFRHDDPMRIPKGCVYFVNDKIAWAYMGWVFAVTTDEGLTWHVWNAWKDLSDWERKEEANYQYIRRVEIFSDGHGTMHLNPIRWKDLTTLHTTDWGKHWSVMDQGMRESKNEPPDGTKPRGNDGR